MHEPILNWRGKYTDEGHSFNSRNITRKQRHE